MCDSKCGSAKCDDQYSYNDVEKIVQFLRKRVDIKPTIGIICGTGLGTVTTLLEKSVSFDYKDIPLFPVSTVLGHSGQLYFGYIDSTPVVCMKGRFHFFEGYTLPQCTLPVRVMKLLGISLLILSNAAGGINPSYKVGDIMLIKDHINFPSFSGHNPLRGRNEEKFGPRFVAVNDAYDKELIKMAKTAAKDLKLKNVQEGVYCCIGGPSFETVAELRAMKMLGADCVGMSTVHEVITAKHCGVRCFAFSLITNKCALDYETEFKPDHEEILEVGGVRQDDIKRFVGRFIHMLQGNKKVLITHPLETTLANLLF